MSELFCENKYYDSCCNGNLHPFSREEGGFEMGGERKLGGGEYMDVGNFERETIKILLENLVGEQWMSEIKLS